MGKSSQSTQKQKSLDKTNLSKKAQTNFEAEDNDKFNSLVPD